METFAFDTLEALAYAECAGTDRVFWALPDRDVPRAQQAAKNAFGRSVVFERDGYADTLLLKARAAQEAGERATFVTSVGSLSQLRREVVSMSQARVGLVIHVLGDRAQVCGDALAFLDFGLGALFAARAQESVDFTWIARRASEDARTPFFVLHERAPLRSAELVRVPSMEDVGRFLGDRGGRVRESNAPLSALSIDALDLSERQYKERVPFALGAASREYESMVGRRHGLGMRTANGKVVLAGLGSLGVVAEAAANTLRRRGVDADAVKLAALRPYDGARVVKALAHAEVVIAIEWENTVLAQSGHLAREMKAALADAVTWTPGYPGITSVPRVVSCGCGGVDVEPEHLVAAALYALEHKDARALLLDELDTSPPRSEPPWADAVNVRAIVNHGGIGEAALDVVLAALGDQPNAHASVRRLPPHEGDAYALDVTISRGAGQPSAVSTAFDVVLVQSDALATAPVAGRLARGGECIVLSTDAGGAARIARPLLATVATRGGTTTLAAPFELGNAEEGPQRVAAAVVAVALALADARFLTPQSSAQRTAGAPPSKGRTWLAEHAAMTALLGARAVVAVPPASVPPLPPGHAR